MTDVDDPQGRRHRDRLRRWAGTATAAAIFLLALTSCLPDQPAVAAVVEPSATVTQTPTSTVTIIWFPPTATFTPVPTQEVTPTPDLRPVLGDVLLSDTFADKSRWQVAQTSSGNIAFGNNELTLAVSTERGVLQSLRPSPQFDNFYLEVGIQPSLCLKNDAYGLLLRASSTKDFYRLSLNCNGQLRMERLKNSKSVPLTDWIASGQILPGGMLRSRLGVWAQGSEMRVYVNGVYHFSVKDPVWSSGSIGVFARAAGETPLSVSFTDLVIYHVNGGRLSEQPPALPTPTR